MCGNSNANVFLCTPIFEVVLTFLTFFCVIRDLIMAIACLREHIRGKVVHIRFLVLAWKRELFLLIEERCAFFEDQPINRNVLGAKRDSKRERFFKAF